MIRPALRQHGLLIAVTGLYALIAFSLTRIHAPVMESGMGWVLVWNFLSYVPGMIYFMLLWRFLHMRFVVRPCDQMAWFRTDIRATVTDPQRIVTGVIGFVLVVTIMISFGLLKKLIPILQPFSWDEAFAAIDNSVHFGLDPWRVLHGVIGYSWIITLVTGAYNYWMFLLYFVLLLTCFSTTDPWTRIRYLIAFVFCWGVGGNLVATLFSSAGPVYYERLGFGDYYAPLMQALHEHATSQPITVLEPQDALWEYYAGPVGLNGISAFPSMHVASTVLMTLYAWQFSRLAGRIMVGFSVVILLGSVLLAWHYAVDGYAGIVIAFLSWWGAGTLMRLFPRWTPPRTLAM
ncbi:phosphatase PAP2 family protein [Pseudogemmobacter humi]|uniref:phosphatase PAP2 family protein n=1 Tax=Pseudogemmobacter humi TaxID=2483812 RepID=UPI001356F63B|nr:phosphatase PAP2 family protein [Pseudogemmobacter humi]